MGTLISPHYLTASFPKLLEKNNLRHIRFHDLRHSCASLLLANGVPLKQIQEWLGKCNGQYPDSAGHKADRLAYLSSCRKSCTPM